MRVLKLAFLCGALICSSAANAGVVFSENFESGTHGSNLVPGWTLTGNVAVLNSADYVTHAGGSGSTGTGQFLAYASGQTPDDGIALKGLALVAGQQYTLSFDYGSFGGPQSIGVFLNNALISSQTTNYSTANLANILHTYTVSFTAPANSITLEFRDTSSSTFNADGLLDNVTIATVPEPSTWAIMILGFAGLALMASRRRRTALLQS